MLTEDDLTHALLVHEAGHLIAGALEGADALVVRPDGPTGAVAQSLVLDPDGAAVLTLLESLGVYAGGPAATCMLDPRLRDDRARWLMDPAAGIAIAAGWNICRSDAERLADWSDDQTAIEFRLAGIACLLLADFIEGWARDNAAAFDAGDAISMDPATVRRALGGNHLLGLADVAEVWLTAGSVANIIESAENAL